MTHSHADHTASEQHAARPEELDDAAWLAAFTEQPGWDERYGATDPVWSGRVNTQLAAEAASLAPGTALDVGCGEGADVLWLAERGWSVTGLDFSPVGLQKAASHAASAGLAERTSWVQADVRTEVPGSYDLVTSHFVHLPGTAMVDLTRRLAAAVAPEGTLLVVGHHPDGLPGGHSGPSHGRDFLFTPEDLLPAFDETWDVEVAEVRHRVQPGPDGEPMATQDSVLRARRRT